jgi:hypothetical protein
MAWDKTGGPRPTPKVLRAFAIKVASASMPLKALPATLRSGVLPLQFLHEERPGD